MKLTENFTLEELYASATAARKGIDNTPSMVVQQNLRMLAEKILQPIRDEYRHPITVTSGYRCATLNKAVNGAKNSQHLTGCAADIKCTYTSKAYLFRLILRMIREGKIVVGQLIWEYGTADEPNWIHVSLPTAGKKNQVLYLYKVQK
ncbi:MAG: peptidase M15 [Bacteroidaceae bacterium]|nr:peptidase M15 [Bacteroidaceae bacterium]